MKRFFGFVVFCVLIAYPILARAEQSLELVIKSDLKRYDTSLEGELANKPIEDEIQEQVVNIFQNALIINLPETTKVYDFNKQKTVIINHHDSSYISYPLHSDISFRKSERNNKIMLGEVLAASGAPFPAFNNANLGMMFGISSADDGVEKKVDAGNHVYKVDDKKIAQFEVGQETVPADLRKSYERYLLYAHFLHPVIRKDVTRFNKVFSILNYTFENVARRNVFSYQMIDAKIVDTPFEIVIPDDYKRLYSGRSKLDSILVRRNSVDNGDKSIDDYTQEIRSLAQQKKYMDAFLLHSEMILRYGRKMDDPAVITEIYNSEESKFMLPLLSHVEGKENIEKNIEAFRNVSREGLKYGYIIDIWIANNLASLDRYSDAVDSMLLALENNPNILGVYVDLASFFHANYDMRNAWICFNEARTIMPNHPMLGDLEGYVSFLESTYPEFF